MPSGRGREGRSLSASASRGTARGETKLRASRDPPADRLADQLNRDASLELADVTLESLVDGRTVTIDQLVLEPRELFAAKALGPRGAAAQRIVTVQPRLQG